MTSPLLSTCCRRHRRRCPSHCILCNIRACSPWREGVLYARNPRNAFWRSPARSSGFDVSEPIRRPHCGTDGARKLQWVRNCCMPSRWQLDFPPWSQNSVVPTTSASYSNNHPHIPGALQRSLTDKNFNRWSGRAGSSVSAAAVDQPRPDPSLPDNLAPGGNRYRNVNTIRRSFLAPGILSSQTPGGYRDGYSDIPDIGAEPRAAPVLHACGAPIASTRRLLEYKQVTVLSSTQSVLFDDIPLAAEALSVYSRSMAESLDRSAAIVEALSAERSAIPNSTTATANHGVSGAHTLERPRVPLL